MRKKKIITYAEMLGTARRACEKAQVIEQKNAAIERKYDALFQRWLVLGELRDFIPRPKFYDKCPLCGTKLSLIRRWENTRRVTIYYCTCRYIYRN